MIFTGKLHENEKDRKWGRNKIFEMHLQTVARKLIFDFGFAYDMHAYLMRL